MNLGMLYLGIFLIIISLFMLLKSEFRRLFSSLRKIFRVNSAKDTCELLLILESKVLDEETLKTWHILLAKYAIKGGG